MSWRRAWFKWLTRSVLAASCIVALAACSTTGRPFDSSALGLLIPGHTTLAETSALFQSDPVNIYWQGDGSAIARWAHKASFVPDAIYFDRELWLAFDADGRYVRVVESDNIPRANLSGQPQHAGIPY